MIPPLTASRAPQGRRRNTGGRRQRRLGGFTLVEIIVSMAILAIAMAGIIGAILHTTNMQDLNRQLDLARNAAMMKLDEVRAQNFDLVVTTYGGAANANNRFGVAGLRPPPAVAANQIGVVAVDNTNANLLDIQIVVTWQSQRGVRRFETSAMITR